jgi:prepilin-type processing-associated H-X9-DG protein
MFTVLARWAPEPDANYILETQPQFLTPIGFHGWPNYPEERLNTDNGGVNILFADGHAQWYSAEAIVNEVAPHGYQ